MCIASDLILTKMEVYVMDFLLYDDKAQENRIIKVHENSDVLHILATLIKSNNLARHNVAKGIDTISVDESTVIDYNSMNEVSNELTRVSFKTTGITIFIGIDENDNIDTLSQKDIDFINQNVFIATLPVPLFKAI